MRAIWKIDCFSISGPIERRENSAENTLPKIWAPQHSKPNDRVATDINDDGQGPWWVAIWLFLSTSKIFHTTVFRVLWEENGLVFRDDIFCVQYYNNMKNYVKLTKKDKEKYFPLKNNRNLFKAKWDFLHYDFLNCGKFFCFSSEISFLTFL